jgi:hypothetical protein
MPANVAQARLGSRGSMVSLVMLRAGNPETVRAQLAPPFVLRYTIALPANETMRISG